jgi:hypothetical protein
MLNLKLTSILGSQSSQSRPDYTEHQHDLEISLTDKS